MGTEAESLFRQVMQGDCCNFLSFEGPQLNYRIFLLDELEKRLAIHSGECSDSDYTSTDFGCLLLQASYEDEATF